LVQVALLGLVGLITTPLVVRVAVVPLLGRQQFLCED
jgi:hypothetical protein